jgi:hypothetical protein
VRAVRVLHGKEEQQQQHSREELQRWQPPCQVQGCLRCST